MTIIETRRHIVETINLGLNMVHGNLKTFAALGSDDYRYSHVRIAVDGTPFNVEVFASTDSRTATIDVYYNLYRVRLFHEWGGDTPYDVSVLDKFLKQIQATNESIDALHELCDLFEESFIS